MAPTPRTTKTRYRWVTPEKSGHNGPGPNPTKIWEAEDGSSLPLPADAGRWSWRPCTPQAGANRRVTLVLLQSLSLTRTGIPVATLVPTAGGRNMVCSGVQLNTTLQATTTPKHTAYNTRPACHVPRNDNCRIPARRHGAACKSRFATHAWLGNPKQLATTASIVCVLWGHQPRIARHCEA